MRIPADAWKFPVSWKDPRDPQRRDSCLISNLLALNGTTLSFPVLLSLFIHRKRQSCSTREQKIAKRDTCVSYIQSCSFFSFWCGYGTCNWRFLAGAFSLMGPPALSWWLAIGPFSLFLGRWLVIWTWLGRFLERVCALMSLIDPWDVWVGSVVTRLSVRWGGHGFIHVMMSWVHHSSRNPLQRALRIAPRVCEPWRVLLKLKETPGYWNKGIS